MKRYFILITTLLFSIISSAQLNENSITISGGYAFAKSELIDTKVTGWRLFGVYEFAPYQNNFAHGISFGYIGTEEEIPSLVQTINYKYNAWPIYYAPRYSFGKEKIKLFVNGALGMHFSNYKQTGALLEVQGNNAGFYGGLGGGLLFNLSEAFYVDVEYNWAYMSNSYYKNGFMNSAMLGIGFRF